jgi:hypothetical protein
VLLVTWASVWVVYSAFDPRIILDPTVILPAPYLSGIAYLAHHDTASGPGYLLGVSWTGGRWWYWPGALLVKTVPTTLLLLIVGPLGWIGLDRSVRRQATIVLAAPALSLSAFFLFTPRDIGLRYALPVIALWLVAASSIVRLVDRRLIGVLAVTSVVGAGAVAMVLSAPSSLAWVAPGFGPAYQVLTNADVDWGQGFYRLEEWSAGKDPWLAYFGPRGLGVGAIAGARRLVGAQPGRVLGWVAVSATDLTSAERTPLAWLRAYCPVGELGGSILVYHFLRPPLALAGPSRPADFCPAGSDDGSVRTAPATGRLAPRHPAPS